jgi:hypothetical protein
LHRHAAPCAAMALIALAYTHFVALTPYEIIHA